MVDASLRRGISDAFVEQLREGVLHPVLERVQHDDTLSLEIRSGYINVSYRGGNLLKVSATARPDRFTTYFDWRYCGTADDYRCALGERLPATIADADDARAWVDAFSQHKQAMDIRFSKHPKLEREYQQAVVRDNNRHATGRASDYVVVDIEYAQSPRAFPEQKADYRFDMVGFRWPVAGGTRKKGVATPVIMEMKTGDAALASNPVRPGTDAVQAGLAKHVRDIERFLEPAAGEEMSRPYQLLRQELLEIFTIKQRLGLPSLPTNMRKLHVAELTPRPEVVFVIANHTPASTVFSRELLTLPARRHADYFVATVQWAGYALFAKNMRPLDEFIEELAGGQRES